MKYIMRALILILVVGFFMVDQLLPKPSLAGTITTLSELKNDPLPHREARVELKTETVSAIVYDSNTVYRVGDAVLLQQDAQFSDLYSVTDFVRTHSLVKLFILFLIVILVVSNWAGLRSLLGLLFSFTVIFKFVLPQIALGSNPLMVALIASIVILLVSYYLTHGIHDKSTIAIIGTFAALTLTGILAIMFSSLSKLTGFGNEDVAFLIGQIPNASLYNLLLAGMIIGSLGVLDDITISQASIVAELSDTDKKLSKWELYKRAMNIGHDHISSLVNTLVLVYAGSALPLLLLFIQSNASPFELLNYEAVAEEVVKTLVGSIGLVAAVPFTTLIAAYWYGNKRRSRYS
jgi:uncharacterized membrane protein